MNVTSQQEPSLKQNRFLFIFCFFCRTATGYKWVKCADKLRLRGNPKREKDSGRKRETDGKRKDLEMLIEIIEWMGRAG